MKFLRDFLDAKKPLFEKGGKYEKYYYIFEANETLLYTPNITTKPKGAQIRDAVDMKRMMMTVIISMIPCLIFGIWNVGHQHYLGIGEVGTLIEKMGVGALVVLPIVAVSYTVGLGIEFTFATIRRHDINEGFLVTGMLIPLIMPPTVPLWQVALATAFGVIIGKEVFGGTGMNILNVALTSRAFLYFAYPSQMSGEVWTYFGDAKPVDGFSGATPLAKGPEVIKSGDNIVASFDSFGTGWADGIFDASNLFLGAMPGSIGETSALMCLLGALILVATGVGSWKVMLSVVIGALTMGSVFNLFGANAFMEMPAYYHLIIGGFAFGTVFMATDPVSAAQTERGKWIYGFLIGLLTVLIRVLNPAYPEGIMLAILLMNVFAPLIDYFVVEGNKKRRVQRATI